MRPAIHGIDGVGKRENIFGVAVVVLQRDLNFDVVARGFHADRLFVQHDLAAGTTLQAEDLRLVEVRLDAVGVSYVRATDADPTGRLLSRAVTADTI